MPDLTGTDQVRLVAALALGSAVALGLSRFAYGLLLPPMRTDLGWTYAQAGAMNTANGFGYLAGALVAAAATRRMGVRATFAWGMGAAAAALVGSGLTDDYPLLLAYRLVAGVAGALTFIAGAVLVAGVAAVPGHRSDRSGLLLGLYTAGAGVGTAAATGVVQPLLATRGASGWAWSWLLLGALAVVCTVATVPTLRRLPEHRRASSAEPTAGRVLGWPWVRRLAVAGAAYVLFGLGYIAYVTFAVDYLAEHDATSTTVTVFFVVLGLAALVGIPVWGWVLRRLRSGHSLALMHVVLVGGALLPLLSAAPAAAVASAALFGSTFLAVPAAVAHLVRRTLPAAAWASAIGAMTVAFAAGQTVGPALAGVLADRSGGSGPGLVVAAVTLALAAVVNLAQPD